MKNITDDDLTLLYYGEHENPALAAEVARSAELSQRFDELAAQLQRMDEWVPPARDEDYGAEIWRRIEPGLTPETSPAGSRWKTWLAGLMQPRYSLAGALSLVLVASLAFMLGRQGNQSDSPVPQVQALPSVVALSGMNTERLLTSSVSGHLEQLNLAFTQFANQPMISLAEAERATDMLIANRLYRKSAEAQGRQQLAGFLADLEPLLIELAYEAHKASPDSLNRMQTEVRDTLLFRVRVMNQQLKQPNVST